jgi:hypothetical protein
VKEKLTPDQEALKLINSPFIEASPAEMRAEDVSCLELKSEALRTAASKLFTPQDIEDIGRATSVVVATFRKELEAIGGQYGKGLEMLNLLNTMLSMSCSASGKMMMGTTLGKAMKMLEQMGAVEVTMEAISGKSMREIEEIAREHGYASARPEPTTATN